MLWPVLLVAAAARTEDGATHAMDAQRGLVRIACLGDSVTRGDARHEKKPPKNRRGRGNYPALVGEALGARFDVRNFGHGGATATLVRRGDEGYVISRLAYATLPEMVAARKFAPKIALWMFGTNDSKEFNESLFVRDFRRTLEDLSAAGEEIAHVVLSPPPVLSDQWGIKRDVVEFSVPPAARRVAGTTANAFRAASELRKKRDASPRHASRNN